MASNPLPPQHSLPPFPQPDWDSWGVTLWRPKLRLHPLASITAVAGPLLFFFGRRLERGGVAESLVAVLALALVLTSIVMVHHVPSEETRQDEPPDPGGNA